MKSLLFRSLIVFSMLGLVACQSTKTSKANEPTSKAVTAQRSDLLITPQAAVDLGYSLNWLQHVKATNSDPITGVSVLGDKIVVIQEKSKTVTALNTDSGKQLWKVKIDRKGVLYKAAKLGNDILINSEVEAFLLNEQTGQIEDIIQLPHVASTSAVVVDNQAIFGTINGRIYSMDLHRKIEHWGYKFRKEIKAELKEIEGSVLVGDMQGVYGKVSGRDGTLLFIGKTFGPIVSQPAVNDLSIFVASEDQFLYAIKRTDGTEQWKLPFGTALTYAPQAFGLSVYLPVDGDGMYALDALSGEILWKKEVPMTAVAGDDDSVTVAQTRGIRILDAKSGDELAVAMTNKLRNAISLDNGGLLLIGADGDIVRLSQR
ncbi:PQQ-binding-like beta-propeller repeat protein [Planctomycetota bacterium]|nr:PQQ-binding-like beta-propeller repeat protein [Planctomycetota bacterium]